MQSKHRLERGIKLSIDAMQMIGQELIRFVQIQHWDVVVDMGGEKSVSSAT